MTPRPRTKSLEPTSFQKDPKESMLVSIHLMYISILIFAGFTGQDARPIDQNHASSGLARHHGTLFERRVCLLHRRNTRTSEEWVYAGVNGSFAFGARLQASTTTSSKLKL